MVCYVAPPPLTCALFPFDRVPVARVSNAAELAEWFRYEPRATASVDSKGRSKYIIEIPLVRRYGYYLWSILAVVSSISFLVSCVSPVSSLT